MEIQKQTLDPHRLVLITGVGGVGKSSLILGLGLNGFRKGGLVDFLNTRTICKDDIADSFTAERGQEYLKKYPVSYILKDVLLDPQYRPEKLGAKRVYSDGRFELYYLP